MTTTLEKVAMAIAARRCAPDFSTVSLLRDGTTQWCVDHDKELARAAIQVLIDLDDHQIWRAAVNAKPGFANLWRATHQAILDEEKETAEGATEQRAVPVADSH